MPAVCTAFGPGRVNLIGDHTDYNGGVALPMAVDLGVTVTFLPTVGDDLEVVSEGFGRAVVSTTGSWRVDEDDVPPWARLVAAMAALARPEGGGSLTIRTTLPASAGLSSSAALCVALARVFGVDGPALTVARLCREAEHRTGAPVGLMDPWVCAGGRAGCALLLDFTAETANAVALPPGAEVFVVDSGQPRVVRSSSYAERVADCEAAAAVVGPLAAASEADLIGIREATLRRRARHVVTECARVRAVADAFATGDLAGAGRHMTDSHRSLAGDFEVSTPALDALVADLGGRPGVYGARLTGAGFGGCVVALGRPGALGAGGLPGPAWRVAPSDGTYADREPGAS